MSDMSTGRGVLIGLLSAFGSAGVVALILIVIWFFQFTRHGRIFLDRLGRPGEYDDEQQFLRDEAEALEIMDELQRVEYMRAKAFIHVNPPESVTTDISLSQFLAIQEKGVSAWEFEPELEIANCFVEARTEVEFFDSECSVQSNLPIPKQNDVYYWEAKIYDKPESTLISVGLTTKPYPLFRLPGFHRHSLAYLSDGTRRHNQPFRPVSYAPEYYQGDVIGVGYRPRTGTVFFTRNGKKLDDVAHGLKTQNFFPTLGANGPCQVHVNFGQFGFVFIEAQVKKWGLAPASGSLAPPPPYGSEQGSILLEGGRDSRDATPARAHHSHSHSGGPFLPPSLLTYGQSIHNRTGSAQLRPSTRPPPSPGPQRSPTDISLAQFNLTEDDGQDVGEGSSMGLGVQTDMYDQGEAPPPDYESPKSGSSPGAEQSPLIQRSNRERERGGRSDDPPIPSYDVAVGDSPRPGNGRRGRFNSNAGGSQR